MARFMRSYGRVLTQPIKAPAGAPPPPSTSTRRVIMTAQGNKAWFRGPKLV